MSGEDHLGATSLIKLTFCFFNVLLKFLLEIEEVLQHAIAYAPSSGRRYF